MPILPGVSRAWHKEHGFLETCPDIPEDPNPLLESVWTETRVSWVHSALPSQDTHAALFFFNPKPGGNMNSIQKQLRRKTSFWMETSE